MSFAMQIKKMPEEKPPIIIHRISTQATGWQDLTQKWAESKKEFQVEDMETHDFAFCQELCEKYAYRYVYEAKPHISVARFFPRS